MAGPHSCMEGSRALLAEIESDNSRLEEGKRTPSVLASPATRWFASL
ncbi:hypothetical protein KQ304_09040 [Synechococcus sp. CS-1329]|nr:hypothetical protein [Synechococcus sp. CS-1329]MCT0219142.1 hypothetical protein [Synechococcus sp. CS-1329]